MAPIPLSTSARRPAIDYELLLHETNHRCSNDLQLVIGLLALQSRNATSPEVRQSLADVMERVVILARARKNLNAERPPSVETALRQLCDALHAQAEPRSIRIALQAAPGVDGLSASRIAILVLVVNELAINAIKHAFRDGRPGTIRVFVDMNASRDVIVTVEDDGVPFLATDTRTGGSGMELVRRMMASMGGLFIPPSPGSKRFELRVPIDRD